jgi:2-iminobutanoate/2-iminopropanoate deaminase
MSISEGKRIISTEKAPKAIGPYSQAVIIDGLVYTAGQIPLDPATMELVEGNIEAQTLQVLTNLKHVLEAAGSDVTRVVKTTVFLADMNDFAAMNTIYAEFFAENPPARSTVAVAGLPKGARVEIELVAHLGVARSG